MKKRNLMTWAVALTTVTVGLTSCGIDEPKPTDSSFETMVVKKSHATGERSADENLCD